MGLESILSRAKRHGQRVSMVKWRDGRLVTEQLHPKPLTMTEMVVVMLDVKMKFREAFDAATFDRQFMIPKLLLDRTERRTATQIAALMGHRCNLCNDTGVRPSNNPLWKPGTGRALCVCRGGPTPEESERSGRALMAMITARGE